MIRLTKWIFKEIPDSVGTYKAHGFVSGHPKLPDGMWIHTSKVESIRLDEQGKRLVMVTHSQNEYELALSDIRCELFEETMRCLHELHIPALDLEECMKLQRKAEEELHARVEGMLRQNELYLMLSGVFTQHAFFKNSAGNIREIRVAAHIGMFQDSYLVTDFGDGGVDFRYWDEPQGIRPYHWSDGLDAVLIENVGSGNIAFMAFMGDQSIACEAGKVTRIESAAYAGEGLISPDAVNGKGLYSGVCESITPLQETGMEFETLQAAGYVVYAPLGIKKERKRKCRKEH